MVQNLRYGSPLNSILVIKISLNDFFTFQKYIAPTKFNPNCPNALKIANRQTAMLSVVVLLFGFINCVLFFPGYFGDTIYNKIVSNFLTDEKTG